VASFINARKRTLFWPDSVGHVTIVPAGGRLELHDAELGDVMETVLRVFIKERFLIRDDGADPVTLH
jgi:hypothetical protein